jgi:hypothetical protein
VRRRHLLGQSRPPRIELGTDRYCEQSRDRNSPSRNYKSTITQLEFIQTGARLFIQTSCVSRSYPR